MPSQEHVKLVRVLIKHVHYFASGANRHPTQSLATLQLQRSARILLINMKTNHALSSCCCRTIIPYIFQKRTFNFLRHAFIHWPLDATFRMVSSLEQHDFTGLSPGCLGISGFSSLISGEAYLPLIRLPVHAQFAQCICYNPIHNR